MVRSYQKFMLFLIIISFAVPFSAFSGPPGTLVVGVISGKPQKRLQEYMPLAHYLASRLSRYGIRKGSVVVAKDTAAMNSLIQQGEVDVVLDSAVSTLRMETAGMVPSLLAWRKGVRSYHTMFLVRKDSSIRNLIDLKGKSIVFEDKNSTSAFAVPLVELQNNGLHVGPADDAGKPEDRVSYLFAGEAFNEAFWVLQGKADAAALNNNDWDELPPKVKSELRIVHRTNSILRYVVSIHRNISPALRKELERVFIAMSTNPEGARILNGASDIKQVEPLNAEDMKSLDYVRTLLPTLDGNEKEHQ